MTPDEKHLFYMRWSSEYRARVNGDDLPESTAEDLKIMHDENEADCKREESSWTR